MAIVWVSFVENSWRDCEEENGSRVRGQQPSFSVTTLGARGENMRASITKVSIIVLALIVGTAGQSFAQDTDPVTTTRDARRRRPCDGGG